MARRLGPGGIYSDVAFTVYDDGNSTNRVKLQLSGVSGTVTLTVPNASGTIALTSDLVSGYQPLDSDLTTIAGLTATTNNFMVASGSAWSSRTPAQAIAHLGLDADIATLSLPASTTISTFGASLVDDADATAAIATLGLDADIATLSLPASTTISTFGASLVDDAAASNARTTLGIGLPGIEFITSVSPSAAASQSIDGCFTTAYRNYYVVMSLGASVDSAIRMRLRAAGVDESGASTYYTTLSTTSASLVNVISGSAGQTNMILGDVLGVTRSAMTVVLTIGLPQVTEYTTVIHDLAARTSTPGTRRDFGSSIRNATTSYDGFTVFPSTGTITGTVKVYGIRDS